MLRFCVFIFIVFFGISAIFPKAVLAQFPDFAVTTAYNISDTGLEDGDIISLSASDSALRRSRTAYDETMHGVYIKSPKIVFKTPGNNDAVARNGEVNVNVNTLNGEIKTGDYVSSSEIAGQGQKATEFTGYMLGVALAPLDNKSGVEFDYKGKKYRTGKIRVAIGIGPASPAVIKASGGLFGTMRYIGSSFAFNLANSKQAEKIIKIILAVIIALASIIFSIQYFGKNVTKGIESIGRNPLAKSTIQTMIVINVILIGAIAVGGIIIALVIISL